MTLKTVAPLAVVFDNVDPGMNPNQIIGFSFEGDASGISGTGTWASDTRLFIDRGGVQVFDVGGLAGGLGVPDRQNDWDFQGSGSTNDGPYSSQHFPSNWNFDKDGTLWIFTFFHDWRSASAVPITWSNAALTIHKIPAPGAGTLLALAGIAAARRRR